MICVVIMYNCSDHVHFITERMTAETMAEFIQFLQTDVINDSCWNKFCTELERGMETKAKFFYLNLIGHCGN